MALEPVSHSALKALGRTHLVAVLLAAALLAGCGGSSKPNHETASTETTTSPLTKAETDTTPATTTTTTTTETGTTTTGTTTPVHEERPETGTVTSPPRERQSAPTTVEICLHFRIREHDFEVEAELPLEAATTVEEELAFKNAGKAGDELKEAAAALPSALPSSSQSVALLQRELHAFHSTMKAMGLHGNPSTLAGPAERVIRSAKIVEAYCGNASH